jgi:Cu+-exporting ATPase
MQTPNALTQGDDLWAEEPSHLEGHARIRARIAGLHCSLCTGTIEKALGRQAGVEQVAVSLTHEQALIDYDPAKVRPQQILGTLRDIGYDLYDPRKLRPFEDEEADLIREGQRLLSAVAVSLTAIALILEISGIWSVLVPASVVVLMVPVAYAILLPAGKTDQSLVTGEPVPTERTAGDEVIGGSINGAGSVLVEVTRTGADSFLAQVVRHVEDARALKPGILHLVDRVLRVYTPTVLIVAALALVGWLIGSWAVAGEPDVRRAVFAGIGVLVMGYPCAVGIAAPLAIVRAAGEAADKGIIMRTGEAFQTFGQVRTIVLDKTGTLTEGRPTVREIEAIGNEAELLASAAAAENPSEHPLARAIVTAAEQRGLTVRSVDDFESITGFGVSASIEGDTVLVGRPAFLQDRGIDLSPLSAAVSRLEDIGRTVVGVAVAGRLQGVIALGDDIRPDAIQAVEAMREAGIRPVLATGDNGRAAAHVAAEVGIEDIRAGILPEEKASLVRELQAGGNRVAMVGDGINDAPALMQADVGIAMGGGTDIAVESADVVIVRDDLTAILEAQTTSRSSYRRTRQNVALAFLFNGIGIPAATTGLVYPVWAMVAMALSVTTIFVNSLGGRPSLLFEAIGSVGRTNPDAEENERQE